MTDQTVLFGTKLDDDNAVVASKGADGRFVLLVRMHGADAAANLPPEHAAGLGLALLAANLDAAGALAAASDSEIVVELALRLLQAHPEALLARCNLERMLATPAGSA